MLFQLIHETAAGIRHIERKSSFRMHFWKLHTKALLASCSLVSYPKEAKLGMIFILLDRLRSGHHGLV